MRNLVVGGVLVLLCGCAEVREFDETYGREFADDAAGLKAGTAAARSGWEQPAAPAAPVNPVRNCYTKVLMNGDAVTNCY